MSTLNIAFKYRPVRIGWCVRDGNWEDLHKVLRLTHTLWGGRYNPVIPVKGTDAATALIEAYQVDCIYPAFTDPSLDELGLSLGSIPWPLTSDLFVEYTHGKKCASLLDIYHPVRFLYETYVRNTPKPELNALMLSWNDSDPLASIFLSTFGSYPDVNEIGVDYYQLIEVLEPTLKTIDIGRPIDADAWSAATPSEITIHDMHYTPTERYSPGIYCGNASNFNDVVNYWNLRAAGPDVYFYDLNNSSRLIPLVNDYLAALRRQVSAEPHRLHEIVAYIGEDNSEGKPPLIPDFGEDVSRRVYSPPKFSSSDRYHLPYFKRHSIVASVDESTSSPSVAFQYPEPPFFEEKETIAQHFVVSIQFVGDMPGKSGYTFRTPYVPFLNEYYRSALHGGVNDIRVERQGVGIVQSIADRNIILYSIKSVEIIRQLLNVYNLETKPSRPGLICERLINQMGGLQGCRVFKIRGVRKLINTYRPGESFTRSAAIQSIRDVNPGTKEPNFANYASLYLYPRQGGKLKPEDAFLYLLEREVFRAGLQFECPSCNLPFWVSIDDLATRTLCEYCGFKFNVTKQLRDRDWAYRRSGLFGQDNNQEGSIPVALTLQQLDTSIRSNKILYSTALSIVSNGARPIDCESDFVALVQTENGRVQLVFGECKANGEIGTTDLGRDLANLMEVADAFPSNLIDVFVLFSKAGDFTESELSCFRSASVKYRHPLILLSRTELEPYSIYKLREKELGKYYSPSNLESLASATRTVYLNPTIGRNKECQESPV